MKTNKISISVLAMAGAAMMLASCGDKQQAAQGAGAPPEIAVITVEPGSAEFQSSYPATIKGKTDIDIRPQVTGFITKVHVDEGQRVRKGQVLFTYFHFACDRALTDAMLASGATCIAYETVVGPQGGLPLLIPMSEVAGRMSVQQAARFLEKPQGGRGVLMGGVPGVKPAKVLVLGAGVVGRNAALMAAGLGADVTITDISLPTLRHVAEVMPANVKTLFSSRHNIENELPTVDAVIGSVLIPGAKAPKLITADMLGLMRPGTVLVDVAIDQGGCFETSHPTTHSDPVYVVDGVVHYAVANIPGAVPYTSTLALTNATLPYALRLAGMGWKEACRRDKGLADGLNIIDGKVTYEAVAEAFGLPYTPAEQFLA